MYSDNLPLKPRGLPSGSFENDDVGEDINPDSDISLLRRHREDNEDDNGDFLYPKPSNFLKVLLAFMSRSPLLPKNISGRGSGPYASISSSALASKDSDFDSDQESASGLSSSVKGKGKFISIASTQKLDAERDGTTAVPRSRNTHSESIPESRGITILAPSKGDLSKNLTPIIESGTSSKVEVDDIGNENDSKWGSDDPPDNSRFVIFSPYNHNDFTSLSSHLETSLTFLELSSSKRLSPPFFQSMALLVGPHVI